MIEAIAGNRKIARNGCRTLYWWYILRESIIAFDTDGKAIGRIFAAYETIARGEDILRL